MAERESGSRICSKEVSERDRLWDTYSVLTRGSVVGHRKEVLRTGSTLTTTYTQTLQEGTRDVPVPAKTEGVPRVPRDHEWDVQLMVTGLPYRGGGTGRPGDPEVGLDPSTPFVSPPPDPGLGVSVSHPDVGRVGSRSVLHSSRVL